MVRRLQDEIRQAKPFRSLEQEAHLDLQRTAAALDHAVGECLKPLGVTATQYNVLRILRGAGAAGLCRNAIRDRLVTPVPDVTRLLDRLEETGLVERERDARDRRQVTARITRQGLRVLARLDEPVDALHRRQFGHLTEREQRSLIELLDRVRQHA